MCIIFEQAMSPAMYRFMFETRFSSFFNCKNRCLKVSLHQTMGRVCIMKHTRLDNGRGALRLDLNETYLLHGTTPGIVLSIVAGDVVDQRQRRRR